MNILAKLLIAFGIVVGIFAGQSYLTSDDVESAMVKVKQATLNPVKKIDSARAIHEQFVQADRILESTLQGIRYAPRAEAIEGFRARLEKIEALFADMASTDPSPELQNLISTAQGHIKTWQQDALVVLGAVQAETVAAPHILERKIQAVRASLNNIVNLAQSDARALAFELERQLAETQASMRTGATLAICIGIALALLASFSLSRPLTVLQRKVAALMEGEYDLEIDYQGRKDEIGAIAKAMEQFRKTALEDKIAAKAEEDRREAVQKERDSVIQAIGSALKRLAAKDVSCRITEELPAAYTQLQDDFNSAMHLLENAIAEVRRSSATVSSGSQEISTASDELSRRTARQAADLVQTTDEVGKISERVRQIAESARRAHETVESTTAEAERSEGVLTQTIDAMGEIDSCSNNRLRGCLPSGMRCFESWIWMRSTFRRGKILSNH